MIKLIALDLDNTLAPLGKPMEEETVQLLKDLEKQGIIVAVCSGKPTYYLCGFMRQVGLEHPVLIGENGAVLQFGVVLPPKRFYELPYSTEAKTSLQQLRCALELLVPGLWYQPNQVALTPFPENKEDFEKIANYLQQKPELLEALSVYRHVDSFDILPKGIDKQAGLRYLGKLMQIEAREMAAIGDSSNDYPMFAYAGLAIGVQVPDKSLVDQNFSTIQEALRYLLQLVPRNHIC